MTVGPLPHRPAPVARRSLSRAVLAAAAILATASAAACSGAPVSEQPPSLLESNNTRRGDGARQNGNDPDSTGEPPLAPTASTLPAPPDDAGPSEIDIVPDAGPDSRTWKGTLPRATPSTFGGSPHCAYRITLEQITAEITALKSGDVTAAVVTASAFEEALPPCTYAPIARHTQTWKLASSSLLASGIARIELAPASTNRPLASLVVEVRLDAPSPEASFAWRRIDIAPPLDWRVNAKLTLAPM